MTKDLKIKLISKHIADLKKSGLSDEIILNAGIETVSLKSLKDETGLSATKIASAYRIPYDPGYSRCKLFYEDEKYIDDNGDKRPKYYQKKGSVMSSIN